MTTEAPPDRIRVKHKWLGLNGMRVFYREAGRVGAPVLLLPHGYPCSSYEFRRLMPRLADRWHLVAPDFPGSGYTDTPSGFAYDFDGFTSFLDEFTQALGLDRFALYLHDFGSQIGLRLAIRRPEKIVALIVQNGDIYEDALGPKYAGLQEFWRNPTEDGRRKIAGAVSEEGFREEFLNEVRPEIAERISPDLWKLHWALTDERRRQIAVDVIAGLRENVAWFPRYQQYLRDRQPPTLIVWGPQDGYMPEKSARAFLRDLPRAELHLLDGGHWLLETNLDEVAPLISDFLGRVHSG
ncbi:alpha/beta fold hydrolase [Neorhizobium galegae]|uniref:alpha/beta fold hydrolase n=1 Tax=Neorhizobium galegae TaxID=399 RepID=UPI0006279BA9|nr:alpha/beta hydrolase [Neorhizobium galegae]MCQ1808297.1 alpha/beta hydrolase [Neorhizobium galegae]